MSDSDKLNFGIGFRSFVPCRSVSIFPSKAPDAVALTVEPTEEFRFEIVCGDALRIRSDVSMLFHAADVSKKLGVSTYSHFLETKRPKPSQLQSVMDSMNLSDDDILSMVKSRHLQSPSEILSWVESINQLAEDMKNDAIQKQMENEYSENNSSASSDVSVSGSSAGV